MSEINQISVHNSDNLSELEIYNHFETRIDSLEKWTKEQIKYLESGLNEYADDMLNNIKIN